MENRKILFVSTNDWVPWGGSEELWSRAAIYLLKNGLEIGVSLKYRETYPDKINTIIGLNAKIYPRKAPVKLTLFQKIKKLIFWYIFRISEKNDFYALTDFRPDLIVINQGGILDGMVWAEECRKRNLNYCFIVQLVNPLSFYVDSQIEQVFRNFSNAHSLYFVSEQNKIEMEKILASKIENFHIVRNPFKEANQVLEYPQTEIKYSIAFVASLNILHKGHDILFEVLKDQKWKNRNIEFNLYGTGPNEAQLNRLKSFYGLENVNFKGFEQNIETIWSANQALILCSRMEGQSLSLIEALYSNRMAIVTNVGGAGELVEDGVNGFLTNDISVIGVDQMLDRAWNNRQRWKEMGIESGKKIRRLFKNDPIEEFANLLISL